MSKQKTLGHYLRFSYFCTMLFWGFLSYLEIYKIWAKGNLFAFLEDGRPYLNDYTFHFAAALLGRDCLSKSVNIYDAQLQFACMKSFLKVFPESPMYMQYPPYCFTLDTPLAYLGLDLSYLIWILASLVVAILAFHYCLRSYLASKIEYAFALTAMLSAFPFWLSIRLGQSSIFLFASMLFFFYFLKGKEDYKSNSHNAFLAGLASFYIFVKLQYLPYIAAIGFLKKPLSFAKGFLLTAALLTAICFITPGFSNVVNYPAALLEHEILKPAAGVSVEEMQNLRGQLTLLDNKFALSHFFPSKILTAGAAALALLYIGSLWWRLKKVSSEKKTLLENLAMATAVLLMLCTSPHVHRQDYVLLVLPALIYHWAAKKKELFAKPQAGKAIKFCSSLTFLFPFLSWFLFIGSFVFQQFLLIQPFFIFALLLLVANIYALEKEWQANKTTWLT